MNNSWSGPNFEGGDLSWAMLNDVDLRAANLHMANLSMADLTGAILPDDVPFVENLIGKVAKLALEPNALNMGAWHTCETTHCIAGWACVIANKPELEKKYGSNAFAALLFARSGLTRVPNFMTTDEEATEFLSQFV